jgi:anaphase-promoting complex subunit 10
VSPLFKDSASRLLVFPGAQSKALTLDRNSREIGGLAVWTVTSAKPGNGVELLRDDREDTYWQSDGTQPHLVNIQFQRKVTIL